MKQHYTSNEVDADVDTEYWKKFNVLLEKNSQFKVVTHLDHKYLVNVCVMSSKVKSELLLKTIG